jgi:hypothetical protein
MRYSIIFPKYMTVQLPQHEQKILRIHMRLLHLNDVANIKNQGLVLRTRHGNNLGWTPNSNIIRHGNTFHIMSTEVYTESIDPMSQVVDNRRLSNLGDEFHTREINEIFEDATVKITQQIRPRRTTTMIEFTPVLPPHIHFNLYASGSLLSFKRYIQYKNYVVSQHVSVVFDVENNCIKIFFYSQNKVKLPKYEVYEQDLDL